MATDMAIESQASVEGFASFNGAFTLDGLKQTLGLGEDALRTARRNGLRVKKFGRRSIVDGRDLAEYLRRCPVERGHERRQSAGGIGE